MTVSWVVALFDGLTIRCMRCGEEYHPNLPLPVDAYIARARAFQFVHAGCVARAAGKKHKDVL